MNKSESKSIKRVAVFLYQDNALVETVEYAARFAARHGAVLEGIFVKPFRELPLSYYRNFPDEFRPWFDAGVQDRADASEKWLNDAGRKYGVKVVFSQTAGDAATIGKVQMRLCDIGFIGEVTGANSGFEKRVSTEILCYSGRPIIVVPVSGWDGTIGQRIAVAWDGSKSSTRALHDALSVLRLPDVTTTILDVRRMNEADSDSIANEKLRRLVDHLSRHDVSADIRVLHEGALNAAELIEQEVQKNALDLLVMGIWGHSHLKEYLFNGVSRTLLSRPPAPMLTSH